MANLVAIKCIRIANQRHALFLNEYEHLSEHKIKENWKEPDGGRTNSHLAFCFKNLRAIKKFVLWLLLKHENLL